MSRVLADNKKASFSSNELALRAALFDRCFYFHGTCWELKLKRKIRPYFRRNLEPANYSTLPSVGVELKTDLVSYEDFNAM